MTIARPSLRRALVAAPLVLLAAPGAGAQRPATADSVRTATIGIPVARTMRSGAAALAEFRAVVAPFDSAGECVTRAEPRAGVRQISAYYPSRQAARSVVTIVVDSAGQLLRYSERRGRVSVGGPGTTRRTEAELRAMLAEAERQPATTITMDLATGSASASNSGGDSTAVGVLVPVDAALDSDALGRPGDRARGVQAKCGGAALRVARMATDSLPRDVVAALFAGGPPSRLRLRVGEAAAELPAGVLPTDGELLGSGWVYGRSTTVLLVSQEPDSARAALESRLMDAGWTRPPAPQHGGYSPRGFVTAAQMEFVQPSGLCSPTAHLTYVASRWQDGRTLLRLVVDPVPPDGYSVCRPPTAERTMPRAFSDSIVPRLQSPPGIEIASTGMSGSGGSLHVSATVDSSIAIAELQRHYGAQLRAAGWELVEQADGTAVSTQLWRKREGGADGQPLLAAFTVSDRPGGRGRSLMLRLEREERP